MAVIIQLTSGHTWNELGDQLTPELLNKMFEDGSAVITNLPIKIGDGGTGQTTATAARNAIGFAPGFIDGCELSFLTTSTVQVATGTLRDGGDGSGITVGSALTADITVAGANGLDTGAEAGDTWYAVHVIADTSGANATASLLSLSATAPTFPSGYDITRRVGWVRNDAGNDFRKFVQVGTGHSRRYINQVDQADIKALTAGNSTTFIGVFLDDFIPETSREVQLRADFENVGGTDTDEVVFRDPNSGLTEANAPIRIGPGILLTTPMKTLINLITNDVFAINYAVTAAADSLDLYVLGYIDEV